MHVRSRIAAVCGAVTLAISVPVHAQAYHVVDTIQLPDGGFLDQTSFDPSNRRIYITRLDEVTAIDVDTGRVTAKFVTATRGHSAIALRHGTMLLVTNGGDNTAKVFDTKTGAVLASIATGEKPDAAIYDAPTNLAVVMNGKSGDLTLIDPETLKSVGTIRVGGSLELAASDGAGRLFINIEDSNEFVIVDLKARKVVEHVALAGCERPSGIGYLPISKRVLSSCHNGVATVTDPARGIVEKTIPIGKAPDAVIYDGRRHVAFVPTASGELDIVTDRVDGVYAAGKVVTRFGARTGAVDELTGRIYLPAADFDLPSTAGLLPVLKPGTTVAVVVEP